MNEEIEKLKQNATADALEALAEAYKGMNAQMAAQQAVIMLLLEALNKKKLVSKVGISKHLVLLSQTLEEPELQHQLLLISEQLKG